MAEKNLLSEKFRSAIENSDFDDDTLAGLYDAVEGMSDEDFREYMYSHRVYFNQNMPVAVEEIPEYYQEPGWGYFYRGSLAGVTGQGLNGWFDLRFRLHDASGNWMDQVVSPAFRIDDQAYSSVATVGSDNAREVARYNLAGQRVDGDAKGVVIVKMSDGTARKVIQ